MNGLEISEKINRLSRKTEALNRILMRVESNMDYKYESKVLKEVVSSMEEEKLLLQDKLRSISFDKF